MRALVSFGAGVFTALTIIIVLHLDTPQQPVWRQCAPSQNGQILVSTVQHKDRTECFYVKDNPKGRAIARKGLAI